MTATLTIDGHELIPPRLTCEDVMRMVEIGVLHEGRGFELIEGVLTRMNAQGDRHIEAVSRILRHLARTLPDEVEVAPAPTSHLASDTMVEPDIALLRYGTLGSRITPLDILLVIEVSASTLAYDLGKKASLYATASVPDYWVVDLTGRRLVRHARPEGSDYREVGAGGWDEAVPLPCAPEVMLDLAALMGPR